MHLQRSYVLAELDLFFLFIDARFDILLLLLLSLSLFSGLQYILSVLVCDLALFVLFGLLLLGFNLLLKKIDFLPQFLYFLEVLCL